MDWNSIMPFIGFGGIITLCTLCFKMGRFFETVSYLKEKVGTNETKSINSSNTLDDKLDKIMQQNVASAENQKEMKSQLNDIKSKLGEHETRLSAIERDMPKRKEDK
jgi:hypothetical protein